MQPQKQIKSTGENPESKEKELYTPVADCRHYNAYYFHENAPAYCPDCNSYPETIYTPKS